MTLEDKLKGLIIEELRLEDVEIQDIKDDDALFGEGLGLDSLDAVELVVMLQKHFKIETKDLEHSREVFTSVKTLADYVRAQQGTE